VGGGLSISVEPTGQWSVQVDDGPGEYTASERGLLRAGKDNQALPLLGPNPQFVSLLGPASPGAMQQQVLHAVPGYYLEACFMDTQDGREHTQLGMLRLVRVV
jgi:hypothetical protein